MNTLLFCRSNLSDNLLYEKHENGHLLKIFKLQEDYASIYRLKSIMKDDEKTVYQRHLDEIYNIIGDEKALIVCNETKDIKNAELSSKNWKVISVKSHGSNEYLEYKNVICLIALNRSPKHIKLLKEYGFDDETIRSTCVQDIYQTVCRSAIRDNSQTDMVRVFLLDDVAEKIAHYFTGCTIDRSLMLEKSVRKVSDNTKVKISDSMLGKKKSNTHRTKISLSRKITNLKKKIELNDGNVKEYEIEVSRLQKKYNTLH